MPEERRLLALRHGQPPLAPSSGGGGEDIGGLEYLQAVLERKPPPGPGDRLRRAYLDLDFKGGSDSTSTAGAGDGDGSSAAAGAADDVVLHFVPATVGDLLSVAVGAGVFKSPTDRPGSTPGSAQRGPGSGRRLRLYVLETPAAAAAAGSVGHLHALDDHELAVGVDG
jgi:hypothetical protein